MVFSIPKMQSYAAKKVTTFVNKKYKTDINLKAVSVSFSGEVNVHGLLIKDHHQDTLISAKRLSTSILNFSELINGNGQLSNAFLRNAKEENLIVAVHT